MAPALAGRATVTGGVRSWARTAAAAPARPGASGPALRRAARATATAVPKTAARRATSLRLLRSIPCPSSPPTARRHRRKLCTPAESAIRRGRWSGGGVAPTRAAVTRWRRQVLADSCRKRAAPAGSPRERPAGRTRRPGRPRGTPARRRATRPLHGVRVADHQRRVALALERPGVDPILCWRYLTPPRAKQVGRRGETPPHRGRDRSPQCPRRWRRRSLRARPLRPWGCSRCRRRAWRSRGRRGERAAPRGAHAPRRRPPIHEQACAMTWGMSRLRRGRRAGAGGRAPALPARGGVSSPAPPRTPARPAAPWRSG